MSNLPNIDRGGRRTTLAALCGVALALASPGRTVAQEFRNPMVPVLDRRAPTGEIARWLTVTGRITPGYLQPVRVILEPGGEVDVFGGTPEPAMEFSSPAQFAIEVGRVYRLRLSDIPQYPGVELYPTIELVDHLHPPEGLADEFPVIVGIEHVDVELAARGRLVTKVIYLEQPQVASPLGIDGDVPVTDLAPQVNALTEADRRGRPIAILRMGGRVPDPKRPDPAFFATGGATVRPSQPPPPIEPPAAPEPPPPVAPDADDNAPAEAPPVR